MNQTASSYPTGDEVISIMGRSYNKNLTLDDPLRYRMYRAIYQNMIYNDVTMPFSRADEANPVAADLPINKGLLIVHQKGVGVSTLFHAMQYMFSNMPYNFAKTNAFDIAEYYRSEYCGPKYILDLYGYKLKRHLVIDDGILGLYYDTTIDIMKELIGERYRLYQESGFKTHFCFNYTTTWNDQEGQVRDMLINVYGLVAYHQLMEMCNLVVWQGAPFKDAIPDRAPRFNTYLKECSIR